MSLARDDIGISGALNAIEAEFLKQGTLEKPNNNKEISGPQKEPEINDVFEKESSRGVNEALNRVEQLQQDYNALEVEKQLVAEADTELVNLQGSDKEPGPAELEKIEKLLEGMAPEQSPVTEQPKRAQESSVTQTTDEQEDCSGKINQLRTQVSEKQQQLAGLQQELREEVNSTVELKIGSNTGPVEQQAESLKKSVVEDIIEDPQKSKRAQITHLNSDLLLAMLSLRA